MRAPWSIAVLMLSGHLVGASNNVDSSCGTCQVGYSCQAGTCVLDTTRLTGNPLPNISSDNPGGPIRTTGMSATTDATSTGESKTTSAATGGTISSTNTSETKSTSKTESHSSSSPSMTSQASSSSPASSSSTGAAASSSSGAASSLSLEQNSWVAWGLAWAVGLPLVA